MVNNFLNCVKNLFKRKTSESPDSPCLNFNEYSNHRDIIKNSNIDSKANKILFYISKFFIYLAFLPLFSVILAFIGLISFNALYFLNGTQCHICMYALSPMFLFAKLPLFFILIGSFVSLAFGLAVPYFYKKL